MNSDNALLLDEFTDRLWLEEGLSRNTLESYRRDLVQFAEWLEKHAGKNLLRAERVDVERHLAARFPLAKVLEGGTWAAGRRIAGLRRPGGVPPLDIDSDGTVF